MIPVGFVLAFYVSMVVNRFWEQFDALPWTMRLGTIEPPAEFFTFS